MPVTLPYLASPGSIKTALERIRSAATPGRVTGDFVSTVLQIKGGTGAVIPSFLKKIGFAASDATPTDIYTKFRNPDTSKSAVADAIKIGYRDLSTANEYFYKLGDAGLLALIIQVTGLETGNVVAKLTFSTLKTLISFADFDSRASTEIKVRENANSGEDGHRQEKLPQDGGSRVGLNLSYTINLNLPATSDQAVFNAIFRSLKEYLLSNDN